MPHAPPRSVEKQMTGHMYKCSLDGSRRWKRRFFVLKDGAAVCARFAAQPVKRNLAPLPPGQAS